MHITCLSELGIFDFSTDCVVTKNSTSDLAARLNSQERIPRGVSAGKQISVRSSFAICHIRFALVRRANQIRPMVTGQVGLPHSTPELHQVVVLHKYTSVCANLFCVSPMDTNTRCRFCGHMSILKNSLSRINVPTLQEKARICLLTVQ